MGSHINVYTPHMVGIRNTHIISKQYCAFIHVVRPRARWWYTLYVLHFTGLLGVVITRIRILLERCCYRNVYV